VNKDNGPAEAFIMLDRPKMADLVIPGPWPVGKIGPFLTSW